VGKSSTSSSTPQSVNPTVLITYNPEKELALLGTTALETLETLRDIKITNEDSLHESITATDDSQAVLDRLEEFRLTLVERIRESGARFEKVDPFFKGIKLGLTMTLPERAALEKEHKRVKDERASYLDKQEQARIAAQQKVDAEQKKKNEAIAAKATQAAKASGADRDTVREIRNEILAAPAPIVESKVTTAASDAGIGLQYDYSAEIFNLRKFLMLAWNNDLILHTLEKAKEDMEKAFRSMAVDQKEKFVYDGIRYKKKPRDVQRRKD
jgi:hypothetical protein